MKNYDEFFGELKEMTFHKMQMGVIMDSILKKEDKNETCPEGLCDGSGYLTVGDFDETDEKRCLCNREESISEMMDDDS